MGTGGFLPEDYLPLRYNDKSELSIVVGAGKSEHSFALRSMP